MSFHFGATTSTQNSKSHVAGKRWLVLGIGIAAQAAFSLAFQGLPAAGNQLRNSYGLSLQQLGLALAAIYLGIVVSEIVWGILTDYVGERIILASGLIGTALVLLALSIISPTVTKGAPAELFLFFGFLTLGILGGSVNGSSGRAVMGWFQPHERGLAMSLRQTAVPFGGAIGAALLPILAGSSFSLAFAFIATCCLLTALAAIFWLTSPHLEAPVIAIASIQQPLSAKVQEYTSSPLRNITVWRIAIASGLLTIPQFAFLTLVPAFLGDYRHVSLVTVSIIIVIVQLIGAFLRVLSGRWTDRLGNRRPTILAISCITTICLFLAALFTEGSIVITIIALALGGIFATSWHGITYTEIAEVAGAKRSGTALGLENTTVFFGAFITPLLGPLILHATNWTLLWGCVAIATALSIPLLPRTRHNKALTIQSKGEKEIYVHP